MLRGRKIAAEVLVSSRDTFFFQLELNQVYRNSKGGHQTYNFLMQAMVMVSPYCRANV